jgi:hypothetical protein
LRANGSRESAPDDRLREAIHELYPEKIDCFVALLLAMTALLARLSQMLPSVRALTMRPPAQRYRRVSRQPAASASSTEQNQRVPFEIFISIFAYQRLVGLW